MNEVQKKVSAYLDGRAEPYKILKDGSFKLKSEYVYNIALDIVNNCNVSVGIDGGKNTISVNEIDPNYEEGGEDPNFYEKDGIMVVDVPSYSESYSAMRRAGSLVGVIGLEKVKIKLETYTEEKVEYIILKNNKNVDIVERLNALKAERAIGSWMDGLSFRIDKRRFRKPRLIVDF